MLTQTCATYQLFQLVFTPSCCCINIHFQQTVADTVQAMCKLLYGSPYVFAVSGSLAEWPAPAPQAPSSI